MAVEYKEHEAVTIEEIRAIAKAPVQNLKEKRIRAAAVLWFLSGIRIGAFVTLPIKALDVENLSIKQWPKLGVRTKFRKHATTYLLKIPELLIVVKEWDEYVRSNLSEDHPWFANISPETGEIDRENYIIGKNRDSGARKDLREWMSKVNLTYHSPHKFRHGFAVFTLKLAKDVGELKAISQNLMHANISITDGIYGILSDSDVKTKITNLNKNISNQEIDTVKIYLEKVMEMLEIK